MIRSLWTSATGMQAQALNLDVISNNLANVNTSGFKKSRAEFQDLLYETIRPAGTPSSQDTQVPTGIQLGHGTRPSTVLKIFSQGNMENTQNELDLAIEGDGFFQITLPNGETAYTRDGAFKLDSDTTSGMNCCRRSFAAATFSGSRRSCETCFGRITVHVD